MSISIEPEIERRLKQLVRTGKYDSESEVIAEALQLLEQRDLSDEAKEERLRRQMEISVQQLDAGESLDGEEFVSAYIARMRSEFGK